MEQQCEANQSDISFQTYLQEEEQKFRKEYKVEVNNSIFYIRNNNVRARR